MVKFQNSWLRPLAAAAVAVVLPLFAGAAGADDAAKNETQWRGPADVHVAMLAEEGRPKAERPRAEEEREERARRDARREREEVRSAQEGDRPRPEEEGRERLERRVQAMRRERAELIEVANNLRRELQELKQAGNEDEAREVAERLERTLKELDAIASGRRVWGRSDQPDQPPWDEMPRAESLRRVRHIRVAAENLHAAGMHEQAERLMQQAERMARAGREGERDAPPPPRPPAGPPPVRERQRAEQIEHAMQQLAQQIDQMRAEMNEMQKILRQLMERERR